MSAIGRGCVKTLPQNDLGGLPTLIRCERMQYSASWQADFSDLVVAPSFYTASAKSGRSREGHMGTACVDRITVVSPLSQFVEMG